MSTQPLTLEENLAIPHDERPRYYDAEKQVCYVNQDVLTAAKERIRHCFITYDRVVVSYSGGKDSLATLYLTRMVADEMGITAPIDVVFRDEELIPEDVIDFVLRLRDEPEKWNLHYMAFPQKSHYFLFGRQYPYVQWDEKRRGNWIRPKPEGAIEQVHPDNIPLDQKETNLFMNRALGWEGQRVAFINGVRCQESLPRFMSCIAIKNKYCYIARNSGGSKNTDFVKVIYDWSEEDIFRFFYDFGIEYCSIYDVYMHASAPLRVATPLIDTAFAQLKKLRATYPRFYEQILSIWPEVDAQVRYWGDYNRDKDIHHYEKSWGGILAYIEDHIDNPSMKKRAIEVIKTARNFKDSNRRKGRYPDAHFGYPLLYCFQKIAGGSFQKGIQSKKTSTPEWDEYEEQAIAEAEERRLGTTR